MTWIQTSQFQPTIAYCSACDTEQSEPIPAKGDYTASKCRRCGLVQTNPVPSVETLVEYYRAFGFLPPAPARMHDDCGSIAVSLLYHLGMPRANSTFLDYGGGYGLYAKAAQNLGWEACLFDYDEGALAFARRELRLPHVVSDTGGLRGQQFDVIWAFHVAEHWRSIDQELDEIDRLLKPSGQIVLATPNARSWEKYIRPDHLKSYIRAWRARGLSWGALLKLLLGFDSVFCWDPPRHLFAFTPKSFEEIASRRGYSCEIRVGSNNDVLYEPRRYINGQPAESALLLIREILKKPWKVGSIRALLSIALQQSLFSTLNLMLPRGGEQLYVVFSRIEKA